MLKGIREVENHCSPGKAVPSPGFPSETAPAPRLPAARYELSQSTRFFPARLKAALSYVFQRFSVFPPQSVMRDVGGACFSLFFFFLLCPHDLAGDWYTVNINT